MSRAQRERSRTLFPMGIFKKRKKDESVDFEARSSRTGLKYKDIMVLGKMAELGADFTQERHVLYYLYSTSRAAADSLTGEASGRNFQVRITDPETVSDSWSIVCERTAVLDTDFVRDHTDFFEGLAERYGAEYDGWEASI